MTATCAPLRSAAFIWLFMLRFSKARSAAKPGGAQLGGDRAAPRAPPVVSTTNTSTRAVGRREHTLVVAGEQRAVEAEREADARRRRTAERLDQAVVATAAAERVLRRVERAALVLERRVPVVVEAAHEPRVDRERDAEVGQPCCTAVEVGGGVRRCRTRRSRRGGDHGASCSRLESSTRSGFFSSVSRLSALSASTLASKCAAARRRSGLDRRARRAS